MVRLGSLRWGPELLRVGDSAGRDLRQERDAELCRGLADILEVCMVITCSHPCGSGLGLLD